MTVRQGKQGVAPTVAEKQEMALLKAAGHSHAEIARRTGRTRECVIAALRSKDVQSLRDRARAILLEAVPQFAHDWREAAQVGAQRGRHEAARDALLHLQVVEPVAPAPTTPGVQVIIGCVPPGIPAQEPQTTVLIASPPIPLPEDD